MKVTYFNTISVGSNPMRGYSILNLLSSGAANNEIPTVIVDEKGIRLEFAQFGHFDYFEIVRSSTPMDVENLPTPIATNIKTMYFVDTNVVEGATYYYRVIVWRDGVNYCSDELEAMAIVLHY